MQCWITYIVGKCYTKVEQVDPDRAEMRVKQLENMIGVSDVRYYTIEAK